MRVLEVGAGAGHIGDVFRSLGFNVTSTDGRTKYVEMMRRSGRPAFVLDLDLTGVERSGDFDLILAFGVLDHLADPAKFILSCGKKARLPVRETALSGRTDPALEYVSEPGGWPGKARAAQ